ncbi:unnamed protein product [Calicophoron daubneyi]|uniref:Strictosidine synthase conserved region domain-containing protein n=1 Tax=Calicophoron daubneyi TaxID=300641 RepID=A0AAV2T4I7_CALDB
MANILFYTTLFVALLSVATYFFISEDIDAVVLDLEPVSAFPENIATNANLSDVSSLTIDDFHGPESLVFVNGSLYTGVSEGKILRVNGTDVHVFANFCLSNGDCGRPAGMRLSLNKKQFFVVDSVLGIYLVSLLNGEGTSKKVFPQMNESGFSFLNDLDVLTNGNLLVSQSSTKYSVRQFPYELMEGKPNGRLLVVNPNVGAWRVLTPDLHIPNGVQLHRDGNSVLVAESGKFRVLRISLTDGSKTVFADGLPGMPDNIRLSPRGGYWVPVSLLRTSFHGRVFDWLFARPSLRRIVFKFAIKFYPSFLEAISSSMLLRLDEDGKIVEVRKDPTNRVPFVSEVMENEGQLYLASPCLPYISHLKV